MRGVKAAALATLSPQVGEMFVGVLEVYREVSKGGLSFNATTFVILTSTISVHVPVL